MAEPSSFHEVPLLRSEIPRFKELTVSTGASQGVLQDVNLPDCAGGYAYRDSSNLSSVTRNRFIYWRSTRDTFELNEVSLDCSLTGNAVSLRLQDAPILPHVTVHETHSHVVILIATINSVHRLVLPHPNRLPRNDLYSPNAPLLSIFADVSVANLRDATNFHVIGQGGASSYEFQTSSSWLTNEGEAVFALATNAGSVVVIRLPSIGIQGVITQHELKQATVMQRLWTGLVPAAMRRGQESMDSATSLTLHPLNQDLFAFCVCKDHKLRMWSCKNQTCVLTTDILDYVPSSSSLTDQPAARHEIRVALGSDSQTLLLGIYLSFPTQNQFLVMQPILQDGQYKLIEVALLNEDSEKTLVDFGLTLSTLWAMWNSPNGDAEVKFTTYEGVSIGERAWNCVFMEPPPSHDVIIPPFLEPREAYLDSIFHPGRFSLQSVARALNIYSRSSGTPYNTIIDPAILTPDLLRDEVTSVIEAEIQQKVGGSEMTQEEYRELLQQSWSRFYTCCVQYHEVANKPLGVMLDPNTGMVCLVKKNLISVLRPCDAVEHIYLASPGGIILEDFEVSPFTITEKTLCHDLITLSECLKMIGRNLSPEIKMSFEHDVYQLEKPDVIAQQIAADLLSESIDISQVQPLTFVQQLTLQLQAIQDPVRSVLTILNALDLAEGDPMSLIVDDEVSDAMEHLTASHLFSSSHGVAILAASFVQTSYTRFQLLRDLLILECAMAKLGDQVSLSSDALDDLESDIISETASCLMAYYSLHWVGNCLASTVPTNSVEANLRQLAALEISESTAGLALTREPGNRTLTPTLAEFFLEGVGGAQMRSKVTKTGYFKKKKCETWSTVLQPCLVALAQMVWPISGSFLFPEFLMGKCQYMQLQEYIRLLNPWCDWNISSRHFLLGHCLLNSGEPHKALACFLRASHRIANEDFLLNKLLLTEELEGKKLDILYYLKFLLDNVRRASVKVEPCFHCIANEDFLLNKMLLTEELEGKKLDILYYLKVIRLLEQFSVPDLVISVANTALSVADDDDPNVPTLWSKVFKYHLELGHNDEAYAAMASNPDAERRRDCLRQFVVLLSQRAQTKELCQYPYIDLHDEVVSIMESRARSSDLMATHNNYYDLLYAFHIFRGNYRKAGSAMYEHAVRLGLEVPTLEGLRKQAKCYLAAMNALELVNPDFAWIVKPVAIEDATPEDVVGASPKRNYDGETLKASVKRQVKVIELVDIRKEFQLVDARLKLANHDPESAHTSLGLALSAEETVSLLVQAGLFDTATDICKTYELELTSVFEGLATKCVKLSVSGLRNSAWKWLSVNDLGTLHPSRELSPADLAWQLLRRYLAKHDTTGDHTQYKCVISKVLSLGYHLPTWLVEAYKRLNPASLLLLYITYDMLEEATALVLEYIDAVCGKGAEYFGLTTTLRATSPSVWLPYQSIDHLLNALRDQTDPTLKQLYADLSEKLDFYHNNVHSVSQDMVKMC